MNVIVFFSPSGPAALSHSLFHLQGGLAPPSTSNMDLVQSQNLQMHTEEFTHGFWENIFKCLSPQNIFQYTLKYFLFFLYKMEMYKSLHLKKKHQIFLKT